MSLLWFRARVTRIGTDTRRRNNPETKGDSRHGATTTVLHRENGVLRMIDSVGFPTKRLACADFTPPFSTSPTCQTPKEISYNSAGFVALSLRSEPWISPAPSGLSLWLIRALPGLWFFNGLSFSMPYSFHFLIMDLSSLHGTFKVCDHLKKNKKTNRITKPRSISWTCFDSSPGFIVLVV